MKKDFDYRECTDSYYLHRGSKGYGDEVFEKKTGAISIGVRRKSMERLVKQALKKGKSRLTIKTSIEDRLGSPGYPEYMWYEESVKRYRGKAVIFLELKDNELKFDWELPEHDQHGWSGW